MEMAERKQYKNIQFKPEDTEEIIKLSKMLEKQLGVQLSQPATIMYAVRLVKKKLKN